MQHKNVWTSTADNEKFVQTKLKRKSDDKDCVNENLALNNVLENERKKDQSYYYIRFF